LEGHQVPRTVTKERDVPTYDILSVSDVVGGAQHTLCMRFLGSYAT